MERGETGTGAHLSNRALRTPKSAAVAGIIFAVLRGASNLLVYVAVPADSWRSGGDWVASQAGTISLALGLLPFAGIAFLWFMAVVRDRMEHLEDQFFSTLFLGSGYLYLGMMFVGAANAGGLLAAFTIEPNASVGSDVYVSSHAVIYGINNIYAIRMAGMHMVVLGTIWVRTRIMPLWLAFVTYALALVLLIGNSFSSWLSIVFPAWVLLISIGILILTYRHTQDQEGSKEVSVGG